MSLSGFRRYVENSFVGTVKKQLGVPKNVWLGMPITVSHTKIGNHMIIDPMTFFVTDFDSAEVTIKSVPKPGYGEDDDYGNDEEDDGDDEINMDKGSIQNLSFTLSKKNFYKLLEPIVPPQDAGMGLGGL